MGTHENYRLKLMNVEPKIGNKEVMKIKYVVGYGVISKVLFEEESNIVPPQKAYLIISGKEYFVDEIRWKRNITIKTGVEPWTVYVHLRMFGK